jgi:hypothetical protein
MMLLFIKREHAQEGRGQRQAAAGEKKSAAASIRHHHPRTLATIAVLRDGTQHDLSPLVMLARRKASSAKKKRNVPPKKTKMSWPTTNVASEGGGYRYTPLMMR